MIVLGEHNGFSKDSFDELSDEMCAILSENEFKKEKDFQREKDKQLCFSINHIEDNKYKIETSYIIGLDWIVEDKLPIYIQPKLNKNDIEIDYLSMLFEALQEPENFKHLNNLYTIDFKAPLIEIKQQQDKLTPLLLLEFLQLVKQIVRKGLKKSYYKVTKNLNSRVKGKILINATVKQNHTKQRMLYNVCQYQEFGYNSIENRILKKALLFTQSALNNYKEVTTVDLKHLFHYVSPAFQLVDEDIDIRTLKNVKSNPLFKEYTQALKLAKLILKKYGYNINQTTKTKIKTPPFWIDMTKLFELYVYKKLREVFPNGNEVIYHFSTNRQELDYLLNTEKLKMVIDAKYKNKWINGGVEKDDIRQVSGYARLNNVYKKLDLNDDYDKLIDCLIIYPNQNLETFNLSENLKNNPVSTYRNIYKVGIRLPVVKN